MMTPFRYVAATGLLIVFATTVNAQTGGNSGSSGLSGLGGNIGLSGLTGGTAGSSTTGGTTSAAGSSTGQTGVNGSGLSGQSTFGGTVPGASTAVSNAAQTFIGSNTTQGFIGGTSQATNQQGSNRQFQAIQNNQSQQNTSQQTGTPREVKTTLRVGFAYPNASESRMNGKLADANIVSLSRFTHNRPELAEINVALSSSGVAVLTGSALSLETSRLAANLMRLQPGVRKVDNQIIVPVN
jgi:hypothetical protein